MPSRETHQVSIRPVEACASHHQDVRPGHQQQRRHDRALQQAPGARAHRLGRRGRRARRGRAGAIGSPAAQAAHGGARAAPRRGGEQPAAAREPRRGPAVAPRLPRTIVKSRLDQLLAACARSTSIGSATAPVPLSTTRAPPPPPTAKCRSPKASRATSTGAEVAAALGQQVLVAAAAARCSAAARACPLSTSAASRRVSMFERDAEALLELVEPRHAGEGVAQDQHAPPLADLLEAAGDRAGHVGEALALHGRHHSASYLHHESESTDRRDAHCAGHVRTRRDPPDPRSPVDASRSSSLPSAPRRRNGGRPASWPPCR